MTNCKLCDNPGAPCFLPGRQEPEGYYCTNHAQQEGFCWGCGQFWGGVESFEFSDTGLCEECEQEQEAEDQPFYDWDDDDWWHESEPCCASESTEDYWELGDYNQVLDDPGETWRVF